MNLSSICFHFQNNYIQDTTLALKTAIFYIFYCDTSVPFKQFFGNTLCVIIEVCYFLTSDGTALQFYSNISSPSSSQWGLNNLIDLTVILTISIPIVAWALHKYKILLQLVVTTCSCTFKPAEINNLNLRP